MADALRSSSQIPLLDYNSIKELSETDWNAGKMDYYWLYECGSFVNIHLIQFLHRIRNWSMCNIPLCVSHHDSAMLYKARKHRNCKRQVRRFEQQWPECEKINIINYYLHGTIVTIPCHFFFSIKWFLFVVAHSNNIVACDISLYVHRLWISIFVTVGCIVCNRQSEFPETGWKCASDEHSTFRARNCVYTFFLYTRTVPYIVHSFVRSTFVYHWMVLALVPMWSECIVSCMKHTRRAINEINCKCKL